MRDGQISPTPCQGVGQGTRGGRAAVGFDLRLLGPTSLIRSSLGAAMHRPGGEPGGDAGQVCVCTQYARPGTPMGGS